MRDTSSSDDLNLATTSSASHDAQSGGTGFLPPNMALNLEAFGKLLRERRQAAQLSQSKLSKLIGLTEATLRNIENAHHPPSEDSLRRLLELPALKLHFNELPTLRLFDLEDDLEFYRHLHWFVAPDYEILKLWVDFRKQLNSEGGHIEQTFLYLDAESAADYVQVSTDYDATFRHNVPFAKISALILAQLPANRTHFDIVALGPGDGVLETKLAANILAQATDLRLRFHLLDISQPLLNVAYKHATDTLSQYSNCFVTGMLGNFYDLPTYGHIFYVPKNRPTPRIFLILGSTLSNIDNEIRFVRHSLAMASIGDMLLLSVRRSTAESMTEADIRKSDAAYHKPFPQLHARWLGGPIRRYCEGVVDISFNLETRFDCVIPDSYATDAVAQVRFKNDRIRSISMCRFKRYNTANLSQRLEVEGWQLIEEFPCKFNDAADDACLLYKKVHISQRTFAQSGRGT